MRQRYVKQLLAETANQIQAARYLEIGLGNGKNFANIGIPHKVGISPKGCKTNNPFGKTVKVYPCTSDEAFKNFNEKPFDLIFIDGMHSFEQVLKDLKNSLKYLNTDGWIAIHDVLPNHKNPEIYSYPRTEATGPWCGDVWKIVPYIELNMPFLHYVLIGPWPGYCLLKFSNRLRIPLISEFDTSQHVSWAKKHPEIFEKKLFYLLSK